MDPQVFLEIVVLDPADDRLSAELRAASPDVLPVAGHALVRDERAGVLSAPQLLTVVGQCAQLKVGGDGYGLDLDVLPTLAGDGVSLDIGLDVTQANESRRIRATVVTGEGEAFLLGDAGDVTLLIRAWTLDADDELQRVFALRAEEKAAWDARAHGGSRARERALDELLAGSRR